MMRLSALLYVLNPFAILWQSLSRKVDITAAFLNGRLEKEVFMKQREGLLRKGKNT